MMMIYGTFLPSLRCIRKFVEKIWNEFTWGLSTWLHEIFIRRNECHATKLSNNLSVWFSRCTDWHGWCDMMGMMPYPKIKTTLTWNQHYTYLPTQIIIHIHYTFYWFWFWFDMKYDFLCKSLVLPGGKYFIHFHSNTLSSTLSKMKWSLARKMTLTVCQLHTNHHISIYSRRSSLPSVLQSSRLNSKLKNEFYAEKGFAVGNCTKSRWQKWRLQRTNEN